MSRRSKLESNGWHTAFFVVALMVVFVLVARLVAPTN
jgi:hypothetical protein